MTEAGLRRAFWSAWLVLLAVKAALAGVTPLFVDEAWYWLEGQHPAAAYSDLPALTAWLVRLGVELGGHSTFGVRWPFLALGMAVPCLVRAAARFHAGPAAGEHAGLLALALPLLGSAGLLALPDVPLTFAAALCLYAALRLCERIDAAAIAWLALGLVVGALSHYRFAPLALAGLAGLLLEPGGRRALRDARTWIAPAAGLAAWLPLLQWNLVHGGAGWTFQLGERHPWELHAEGAWLPLSQLVVVGPLLLALLLLSWAELLKAWRARRPGAGVLLGAASVPLLLYLPLAFIADRERVSFHWLLQAWLALLVAAPLVWMRWPRGLRVATAATSALLLAAAFGFAALAAWPAAREAHADRPWYPQHFAGYEEAARWVRASTDPARRLVVDDFMLAGQLGFLLQRSDLHVLDHPRNHKHGRAAQLQAWGLATSLSAARTTGAALLMDDSAIQLRRRLAHYRRRCSEAGGLDSPQVLEVDRGRRRFLRFDLPASASGCRLPAVAWLDTPLPGAAVQQRLALSGWAFKDGAGLARVEVTLDGRVVAQAQRGIDAPHVAEYWGGSDDPDQPAVGFRAEVDLRGTASGTHWLGLVLHGRDGSREPWPEQRVEVLPAE